MSSGNCVERAIRDSIRVGTSLLPPNRICGGAKGEAFIIKALHSNGIRLSVGRKNAKIDLTWIEMEGVLPYLQGLDGDIKIGAVKAVSGKPNTLDGYLKRNSQTMRSSYAASILHEAGIVEIICGTPMRIRLGDEWR